MRKTLAALVVLLGTWTGSAQAAINFEVDAQNSVVVGFSYAGWDVPNAGMLFDVLALEGGPSSFAIAFDGIFAPDGRSCQPRCEPLRLQFSEQKIAGQSLAHAKAFDFFAISTSGSGTFTFSTLDPDAKIHITNLVSQHSGLQLSGPVPEPATWAMMLAGFGLVGTAMRRRSVQASVSDA